MWEGMKYLGILKYFKNIKDYCYFINNIIIL